MTCTLQAAVYNKTCVDCMTRKIVSLRSPDKRTTLKKQMETFTWMGWQMAGKVKEALKNAA